MDQANSPGAADPFDAAANYYDVMYHRKPYAGEAALALDLLRHYSPRTRDILDVGCGTGRHAVAFSRLGCRVVGVDRNEAMLEHARRRSGRLADESRPTFVAQDIRSLKMDRRFDAAVSLFHVFSYLRDPLELRGVLRGIRKLLRRGGLLLFDCWYGPAVLCRPPQPRRIRVVSRAGALLRSTTVRADPSRRMFKVHQRFEARHIRTLKSASAVHRMRYWFKDEISAALKISGFELLKSSQWRTGRALSEDSWTACFVARRIR